MLRGRLLSQLTAGLIVAFAAPTQATGSEREAAAAYAAGRYAEVLERLPAAGSLSAGARLLRARSLLKFGQHAEARRTLKDLVKALPHLRDLIRMLQGEALMGLGKHHQAARLFRAAARARGSRWVDRAWRRRADALAEGGRCREAEAEYRHALRIYRGHPRRPGLELARARCLEKTNRRARAAAKLQEIWLLWPASAAARAARQDLDRLLASGVRVATPPFWRRLNRVRALRRSKLYKEAAAELDRMRARRGVKAAEAARLDTELARTLLKDCQDDGKTKRRATRALSVLKRRYSKSTSKTVLSLRTRALSILGRVDEATRLIRRSVRPRRAALKQASRFLASHGRYVEAFEHRRRAAAHLPRAARRRAMIGQPWLAYRAGKLDLAIKGFRRKIRRARGLRTHYRYWLARALQRAGRGGEATALYRQLVEKRLRSYYGIQARSRLVEAKKLSLPPMACARPARTAAGPGGDPAVPRLLAASIVKFGDRYPSLGRAETLWNLGMRWDARRELRMIAFDFAWVRSRGRSKWFIRRPESVRMWAGGPPIRRRMRKRERQIYRDRGVIGKALGELMSKAGIFYFGWRFSGAGPNPIRHRNPQGFHNLVRGVAGRYRLNPHVVWAIMRTESAFRSDAISRVGARGLMQVMPTTARLVAAAMKTKDFELDSLFQPETSLEMAGWYMRSVSDKFRDQLMLVAAGYNGGPHNVARWLTQRGKGADLDEFIEEIPFSESRRYAKKILRLTALYERLYCNKDDRVTTNSLITSFKPFPWF